VTSSPDGSQVATGGNHAATDGRRSIGELLSDVSQDVTTLLRQEVALAKAEVRQSVSSAGKGVGMFAGAGVAGHMVLLFLSIAGWWALGDSIGRGWSGLVVALVWLVIAAILGVLGRSELKSVGGVPQTTDTIKKIPNAAKGHEEMS
jgi:hypothetical protein